MAGPASKMVRRLFKPKFSQKIRDDRLLLSDEEIHAVLKLEEEKFRVEDSDGGFFESFTALSWKQENRRLQLAREDEKEIEKEKQPPPESSAGVKIRDYKITKEEKENLYADLLYTIRHRIQIPVERDEESDMIEFVREVFDISTEVHTQSQEAASENKPPALLLNVTVMEAQGLEAKDPNGYSDPYCMLGIQPGTAVSAGSIPTIVEPEGEDGHDEERQDKPKRSHGFRLSFKRKDRSDTQHKEKEKEKCSHENIVAAIPAKLISATSVQAATLNPHWEEKFQFDVDDIYSDKLHLDIWDHDDESSVLEAVKKLNEIATWKGLGRYFKQIAQSARLGESDSVDDFLGSVTIPLNSIPSTGVEKWFELQGRSQRSNVQGHILLRLNWSVKDEGQGTLIRNAGHSFQQHERLYRIFIEREAQKHRANLYAWDGELPMLAQSILRQHAILGDLTQLQQVMCQWIAYSRKHMQLSLNYALLYKTLEHLNNTWASDNLSSIEEEVLAESFSLFVDFCLSLVRKQRDLFPSTNKAALNKLEFLLRCLALIQSMQAFWRCCPFHKELHFEVGNIVKKGTMEWYEKMNALSKPQIADEDSVTRSFIELTNTVNTDLQRSVQHYNKMYEDIMNVSYFSLIYKQFDRLLIHTIGKELNDKICEDVRPAVEELCISLRKMDMSTDDISDRDLQIGTAMFELYMALQEFFRFKNYLSPGDQANLNVPTYPHWFTDAVNSWLLIARYKSMLRIKRAVELEKVVDQVDSLVKHSTSAVDTTSCFYQIKIFWKQLAWPDLISSFVFITKILDDICSGATYYAALMYKKLCDAGFYDVEGQFDVTEQLCITINNIEHVRLSLRLLPQELDFEAVIQAVEQSQGEAAGRQGRTAFNGVLDSAVDDVENQIHKVVEHIGERMRLDIRKYAFHLSWAPDGLPAEEAIVPLMEYLDNNLTTLSSTLLNINFDRILIVIWNVVMEEVQSQAESGIGEKQQIFFERLHNALAIMLDFFHAEEKGLSLETLHNLQYQKCQRLLNLHRMDTSDLIIRYYDEKLEDQVPNIKAEFHQKRQKTTSTEFGVLTVRVYFHHDSLSIEVISARDIIPLDANGFSDPFVILEILPPYVFRHCPVQRTRVQKRTLQPVFDEIFEYTATLEQCQDKSSMIQFTVMDHDLVLSNDFAGEAFLSLNHIPGVDERMVEDVATLHGLKPIELNLLRPRQSDNEILRALEKRPWDKAAQDFVKCRKAHSS